MVKPFLSKRKVVHKTNRSFERFQSDRFARVKSSWRKPRGIDNRCRRQFKGNRPLVRVGYANDRGIKFHRKQDGFKTFVIHNIQDVELILMHNRTYVAQAAANLSARSREKILERCRQLDIKLLTPTARIKREETK